MKEYTAAIEAKDKKNFKKAIELFNLCRVSQEKNPEFFMMRSVCYSNLKDYSAALDDLDSAIKLNPKTDLDKIYHNKGLNLLRLNRAEDAVSCFDRALSYNSENVYSYYYRGLSHYKNDEPEKAVSDFTKTLTYNDKYSDAYFYRGMNHEKLSNYKAALNDFDKAVELDPGNRRAIEKRANLYVETGQHRKALDDLDRLLLKDPSLPPLQVLEKKKLIEKALEEPFDEDRKLDFGTVYFMSGLAKISAGQYEGALEDYDKAIEINPNSSNAYYYRSLVKMHLSERSGINMKQSALLDQERSLEINPDDAKALYFNAITRQAVSKNNDFVHSTLNANLPWAECCGVSIPAEELGGDYFYFYTDPKAEPDQFSFTIGDVSGKGTKSAMFVSVALQLKSEARKKKMKAAEILNEVNQILCAKTGAMERRKEKPRPPKPPFITSIFADFHKNGNISMDWSNAGHLTPFLLRDGQIIELHHKIQALSINSDKTVHYASQINLLKSGDRLYFYSDGLFEEKKIQSIALLAKIKDWILKNQMMDIKEQAQGLISFSKELEENEKQSDDMTIVIIGIK